MMIIINLNTKKIREVCNEIDGSYFDSGKILDVGGSYDINYAIVKN